MRESTMSTVRALCCSPVLSGELPAQDAQELATALNHHLTEEELTILNPAREEVGEKVRAELGVAFATERNAQLDADCGAIDNVRRIVEAAEKEGLLDDEEDDESDD